MDKLIEILGGRVSAARCLGITPSYISMLKNGKRKMSPELAMAADKATRGQVRKGDLRPDLWPPSS